MVLMVEMITAAKSRHRKLQVLGGFMWGDDPELQQLIQEEMEATKDFVVGHCIHCGRSTWEHKDNLEPKCIRCVCKDAKREDCTGTEGSRD